MRTHNGFTSIRRPAVAGFFYPDDASELQAMIAALLARQSPTATGARAYIVPHAGYVYSGEVAAAAYACVAAHKGSFKRVAILGPSHRVFLRGLALPEADAFATPLGALEIDQTLRHSVRTLPAVVESDEPHRSEHSLEVQLPFVQVIKGECTILPIAVGSAPTAAVAQVISVLAEDPDVLILASSDLSHYLPYAEARRVDRTTSEMILRRDPALSSEQACGAAPVNGLLHYARDRQLQVTELARCNSGDTAGDRDRVVGYGAYAFYNVHDSTAA